MGKEGGEGHTLTHHTLILPGLEAEVSESMLVIQRARIGLGQTPNTLLTKPCGASDLRKGFDLLSHCKSSRSAASGRRYSSRRFSRMKVENVNTR